MEPFIGQIEAFGFNFAPRGWAFCAGQSLSIAQNTALFSLLGTTYGGNGQTTFNVPDLRGRVAIGMGNGPGLTPRSIGEASGTESTTLTINQMPAHTHPIVGAARIRTTDTPGNFGGSVNNGLAQVASATNPTVSAPLVYDNNPLYTENNKLNINTVDLSGVTLGIVGSNNPVPIMQPYLVINYCIALEGIFPSRN